MKQLLQKLTSSAKSVSPFLLGALLNYETITGVSLLVKDENNPTSPMTMQRILLC